MTDRQVGCVDTIKVLINTLLYTERYSVHTFDVTEVEHDEVKVYFKIRREDYNGDIIYQDGTVYITPRGKIYYVNYMGNKKNMTTIQSVVSPFGYDKEK